MDIGRDLPFSQSCGSVDSARAADTVMAKEPKKVAAHLRTSSSASEIRYKVQACYCEHLLSLIRNLIKGIHRTRQQTLGCFHRESIFCMAYRWVVIVSFDTLAQIRSEVYSAWCSTHQFLQSGSHGYVLVWQCKATCELLVAESKDAPFYTGCRESDRLLCLANTAE